MFHYCIVQCFAWVHRDFEHQVTPGDDAADARWFTTTELRALPGAMAEEMCAVVELSEGMSDAGLIARPKWK